MNPFAGGLRQSLHQVLSVLLILSSALMIWKTMSIVTNSEAPIVVVLTESMTPAFVRGDLLFLHQPDRPLDIGEIIVYKLEGKDIPIVHRIISAQQEEKTGKQLLLTKGDYNDADDRGIYAESRTGKLWLSRDEVVGVVNGYVPAVGYVTIMMNDFPRLKYVLLGGLGLFALFSRE
ncbi:microsomal signal peptidase subunit [Blastocladiella britannica]|nr:microsomal signal peptidase subunit [Blastocladiella britannica]